MTLKEKLNELLANNKLEKAIDLLMGKIKNSEQDIYNTLILIKSRYSSNERDNNLGILSRGDYQRTNNQIIHAIQQTMDKVQESIMEGDLENTTQKTIIKNDYSQKEIEGNKTLLNVMSDKLNHLKKEQILTYDAEKKFALNSQIEELERKIEELNQKIYGNSNITKADKNSENVKKQVLFICSSPTGMNPLDFGTEFKKIKEALKKGAKRDYYDIEIETGVESDKLINKLTTEPYPFIVHISLHSSKSEGMYFEDEYKNEKTMSVEDFKEVFSLMSEINRPELVILSACNSLKHAEAIKPYAKFVVGTKDFFPDKIAILYANKLYEMIFDGKKIDFAHKTAVLAIKQAPVPEEDKSRVKTPLHEIPVLLT